MKFSIITPTHKRKDKLERAAASLLSQTYTDWEMIIINDSPQDRAYDTFAISINDARIHYYVNATNKGKNFSCNYALDKISADSRWIIFLDDDDYFAPDTLATFHQLVVSNNNNWFVTNRAYKNGTPLTRFPLSDHLYSYVWEYLIFKKLKGDATHCLETKLITHTKTRFSNYVKQGEEWFFFYQIGMHAKMYYYDHNSTITDGYDRTSGLNYRKRNFRDRYESLIQLFYEGSTRRLLSMSFILYIFLRFLQLFVK